MILSVVVFVLTWVSGDPVLYLLPFEETTEVDLEKLRHEYGLDRPLFIQYFEYLERVVRGDFGISTQFRREASGVIKDRIVPSLHLGAMALVFVLVVAFPLGVFAAYNRGRIADTISRTLAFAGQSVPEFWLGLMLILVFVV